MQLTEEQRLERKLISRFQKAIVHYHLIDDDDRILVALSGGKDSLFLLEMLARRMRVHRPAIHVEAIHIRMENIAYESDAGYLENFAKQFGIKLHLITTSFDVREGNKKPPCFLCSWNRRKQIFNFAQEHGFNKIALGHHMDDILHTTLMNEFFQGSFSSMPVKLEMRKMPLTLIRPLALCQEEDIRSYAQLHNYQKQKKLCPYETDTHRADIRKIFQQIEDINPEARYSLWQALEREGKLIEES